jgi:hypothetical protein
VLGDFNAKLVREDIFKPTAGNGSLLEIIMVMVVTYSTPKNLVFRL